MNDQSRGFDVCAPTTGFKTETACRLCGGALGGKIEFGRMPLVNRVVYVKDGAPEPFYPLTLTVCTSCGQAQLAETVDPKILFAENYPYYSSSSRAMVDAMASLALEMSRRAATAVSMHEGVERPLRVLEVASNDGYLLQHYKAMGHKVVGIEPAAGPAKVADERGIWTWNRFFSGHPAEVAHLKKTGPAFDIIHAHNVVAHVAELLPFLRGIRALLNDQGIFVLEVPDFLETLRSEAFDQVYHEHVFYFTPRTIAAALARAGLAIVSITPVKLHGGSLRVTAMAVEGAKLLDAEPEQGVLLPVFAQSIERQSDWLRSNVLTAKDSGKRVAAYGASAKGCMRLMQARLGPNDIDFVADKTMAKHGRLVPGVRIPIVAAEELAARRPDLALLLTWNFEDEIRKEQVGYLRQGGRFLNPLTGKIS